MFFPLLLPGKQVLGTHIHLYSVGQAGFSVHFPPSQSEVLVGAPGVYNWKGTVIHFGEHFGTTPGNPIPSSRKRKQANRNPSIFSKISVPNPRSLPIGTYSYFGEKFPLIYVINGNDEC